jgi:hypothetical protein
MKQKAPCRIRHLTEAVYLVIWGAFFLASIFGVFGGYAELSEVLISFLGLNVVCLN